MRNRLTILTTLTILLALNRPAVADDELSGRLFTTPAERARLDLMHGQLPTHALPDADSPAKPDAEPESITLNGFVTRSSGKTTTWINQIEQGQSKYNGTVHVLQRPGHAAQISMKTASGKPVNVKVGDTLDLRSGTVHRIDEQTDAPPAPAVLR